MIGDLAEAEEAARTAEALATEGLMAMVAHDAASVLESLRGERRAEESRASEVPSEVDGLATDLVRSLDEYATV